MYVCLVGDGDFHVAAFFGKNLIFLNDKNMKLV
jgi:hypothetical protein